jgi:ABC-2 type transport system ATP-binding protein
MTTATRPPDGALGPAQESVRDGSVRQGSAISVVDLVKVYKGGTRAVDGISVEVSEGEIFGFLGPNGAGKTTTIRVLATLLRPTSGTARVAGLDVVKDADEVRRRVGFAMQSIALDDLATGREHLELMGRLHGMPSTELRQRVEELLELVGLTNVGKKLAGTYSGGMRRRLDLATALVHRPEVLFLDEPTEGLDPQSRIALWEELRRVNERGTTLFLTTHFMDEADKLCQRLAIIDQGRIVVEGRPEVLRRSVGGEVVSLVIEADGQEERVRQQTAVEERLAGFDGLVRLERQDDGVALYVTDAAAAIPGIVRRLDGDGISLGSLTMSRPTLDDVFLQYTGKRIREEDADRPLATGWFQ